MWQRVRDRLSSGPPRPNEPVALTGSAPATPHSIASSEHSPGRDSAGDYPPRFFPLPENERALNDDGRNKVVGESFYQSALMMVAGGRSFPWDFDCHLPVKVALRPDPSNAFDSNAVRVEVFLPGRTVQVGHIPAVRAGEYQPQLLLLEKDGFVGTCPGRVCGGARGAPMAFTST